MSTVSTHVLDTSLGKPAAGVRVTLEQGAEILATSVTDADGRIAGFADAPALQDGPHRLRFLAGEYFAQDGRETFYPEITVNFQIGADGHYHVPLLLSPFGYSTYRGS